MCLFYLKIIELLRFSFSNASSNLKKACKPYQPQKHWENSSQVFPAFLETNPSTFSLFTPLKLRQMKINAFLLIGMREKSHILTVLLREKLCLPVKENNFPFCLFYWLAFWKKNYWIAFKNLISIVIRFIELHFYISSKSKDKLDLFLGSK